MKCHTPLTVAACTLVFQSAYASPVNYIRTDIVSSAIEAGQISSSGIVDEFSMDVAFNKTCIYLPISLNCNFSFDGRLSDSNGSDLLIELDNFTSTGPGLCSSWIYSDGSSQPWRGTIPHATLPTINPPPDIGFYDGVPFTLSDVSIQTACGACEGELNGWYTNHNGGEIAISGSLSAPPDVPLGGCALSGVLRSNNYYYEIWH